MPQPTGIKRRERILDVALELFAEQGFTGTTISEVERRVGLTPGTGSFYRHFQSKEALLRAAVDREVERCMREYAEDRALLPPTDDPAASKRQGFELALMALRRFDRLFQLVVTEGDRVPLLREAITAALRGPGEQLDWRDDPATVVVLAALGGYHLFSQFQGHPFQNMPQEEFLDQVAKMAQ